MPLWFSRSSDKQEQKGSKGSSLSQREIDKLHDQFEELDDDLAGMKADHGKFDKKHDELHKVIKTIKKETGDHFRCRVCGYRG